MNSGQNTVVSGAGEIKVIISTSASISTESEAVIKNLIVAALIADQQGAW